MTVMKKTLCSVISPRALVVGAIALSFGVFAGWEVLRDTGMVGATKKNGFGCTCHDVFPSDTVRVWIEGPSRLRPGTDASFQIVMTGGPGAVGGFNVAAGRGTLSAADSTATLLPSADGLELTQSFGKEFTGDTVRWAFRYEAPGDTTADTLYSVGNSADGNHNPNGDLFNFGENFIVDLSDDTTLDVAPEALPRAAALLQNYPNPFNPSTMIRFELAREGTVELSILDLSGRTVAVLARAELASGSHAYLWDASGRASGIYFCRISAPGLSAARKMLLLR
jgi:hypothetical protein